MKSGQTEPAPTIAVIVVAAGSGSRLGRGDPKALVVVAGLSILQHALDAVFGMADAVQVVVVAPPDRLEDARHQAEASAGAALPYLTVVAGRDTRQASVLAGLTALDPGVDVVLVHDAARPFTPSRLFDTVADAVAAHGAVVPGLAVADTIKETDASGRIIRTVDRSTLSAVQTPQGFPRAQLVAAYVGATEDFTDDAALFAAAGNPVTVIEGDPLAFKITTPWDLRRAETLAAAAAAAASATSESYTGIGIDVHSYENGRPLWLGTMFWPNAVGLAGHSDGDALSHAICDALLSAAGLGDLGSCFGTTDPRFRQAHGDVFLRETTALVTAAGYSIANVAVQLVARHPKLAERRLEMEARLSDLVGAPVRVAATTSDGLGFTGRGEGAAAIATALVYRNLLREKSGSAVLDGVKRTHKG